MSNELIRYAFTAGELAPTLFGRGDLEKYDFGLAEARNWFVDYRGGLATRPGSEFVDYVPDAFLDTQFFEFKFNADIANTYVIIFGHNYIRFLQDGAYVLEANRVITGVTAASPGVVTSVAHGYTAGQMVKIAGRTFKVGVTTANTFQLLDIQGANFNTVGQTDILNATAVARIYTVTSTYTSTQVRLLNLLQINDTVRITHPNHPIRDLTRTDHANWTLSATNFNPQISAPTGVATAPRTAGTSGASYAVTAVDLAGAESLINGIVVEAAADPPNVSSVIVTWNVVSGAEYYNVYRSNFIGIAGSDVTKGAQLGFLGRTTGAKFVDFDIIPDFTKTPPQYYNPFAEGRINHINVTAAGAGYTNATTMSIATATGSGFVGVPIVNPAAGTIIGVLIIHGGVNYAVTDTVSFTVGAGATATIVSVSGTGTTFPSVSGLFQQRQIYAASLDQPLTVWGSRPKQYNNFDTSQIVADSDSFEFDLESPEVTPIRHMFSARGGLLLMHNSGIWQLSGGSANDAITPTNALAEPHTYTGVSKLRPLSVDVDILYSEDKGNTVRLLSYNDISKVYGGQDVSILSNHFFSAAKQLIAWTYAADPYKLVHAVRSDGAMLCLTTTKEQNVYAWTQWWTQGYYRDVVAIRENDTDAVYWAVERYINNNWVRTIERQRSRTFDHVEDAWCVDSGLELGSTSPAAILTVSNYTGTAFFDASAAVFAAGDVGKILRAGGGKALITVFNSATRLTGIFLRDITEFLPEVEPLLPPGFVSGSWTLDTPVSSVSGLWHLEGQTVQVFADGNVQGAKVVTNGAVTLDAPATRVIVGLKYTCRAKTLPPVAPNAVIEARRKRNVGIAVRNHNSRGVKLGRSLDRLYEAKERTTETYGEPTALQQGMRYLSIEPDWTEEGQFYIVQDNPLPATIVGYVQDIEVGDDPD